MLPGEDESLPSPGALKAISKPAPSLGGSLSSMMFPSLLCRGSPADSPPLCPPPPCRLCPWDKPPWENLQLSPREHVPASHCQQTPVRPFAFFVALCCDDFLPCCGDGLEAEDESSSGALLLDNPKLGPIIGTTAPMTAFTPSFSAGRTAESAPLPPPPPPCLLSVKDEPPSLRPWENGHKSPREQVPASQYRHNSGRPFASLFAFLFAFFSSSPCTHSRMMSWVAWLRPGRPGAAATSADQLLRFTNGRSHSAGLGGERTDGGHPWKQALHSRAKQTTSKRQFSQLQ